MIRNASLSKKDQILEEAASLFQEKGYLATSMRELAERVGLQVSSLYSHWGKKEEILQKICFDNARRFLEGMKEVEELETTPTEKVKALICLHIRIATSDVTSVTIFNDEWRHLSEPYLGEFLAMRKEYERRFARIIRDGIDRGLFLPVNVTVALFTILTSVRWLHRWYSDKRGISVKALEQDIVTILLKGLESQSVGAEK